MAPRKTSSSRKAPVRGTGSYSFGASSVPRAKQLADSKRGRGRSGVFDPDHDGDNDASPAGDTDNDYAGKGASKKKSAKPGGPMSTPQAAPNTSGRSLADRRGSKTTAKSPQGQKMPRPSASKAGPMGDAYGLGKPLQARQANTVGGKSRRGARPLGSGPPVSGRAGGKGRSDGGDTETGKSSVTRLPNHADNPYSDVPMGKNDLPRMISDGAAARQTGASARQTPSDRKKRPGASEPMGTGLTFASSTLPRAAKEPKRRDRGETDGTHADKHGMMNPAVGNDDRDADDAAYGKRVPKASAAVLADGGQSPFPKGRNH